MRRVSILYVQDQMEGEKSKELGELYKLYYSAATADGRNGVGEYSVEVVVWDDHKRQTI